jgi:hypothetical protein
MHTEHTSCSAALDPQAPAAPPPEGAPPPWGGTASAGLSCLASSHGLCWSTYSFTRSASCMISRTALPNSRSSYNCSTVARCARRVSSSTRPSTPRSADSLPAKALGEKARGAAGDVDVLADEVGIDAGDEVLGVELDILDAGVELGGDVVAQPLGVQPQLEVAQRAQPVPRLLLIFSPPTVMKPCTNTWLGTLRPLKCSMAGQNSVWK